MPGRSHEGSGITLDGRGIDENEEIKIMIDIHWPSLFLGIVSTTLAWYLWVLRLKKKIDKLVNECNLNHLVKMQSAIAGLDVKSHFGRSLER